MLNGSGKRGRLKKKKREKQHTGNITKASLGKLKGDI